MPMNLPDGYEPVAKHTIAIPPKVTVQRNGFAHWSASWQPPLKPDQWATVSWSVVGVTRGSALRRAARMIRQQERNAATVETVEVTTR